MKRLKTLTAVLALVCICSVTYIACKGDRKDDEPQNCVACTKKTFCGIPPAMLLQLIRNYKQEVWQKTSNEAAGQYDARFLEISIEDLENFICIAKSSAEHDSLHVASVRIYYINYEGEKKVQTDPPTITGNVLEDFSGCHSLAFVPVVGKDMKDADRRDYYMIGQDMKIPFNLRNFQAEQYKVSQGGDPFEVNSKFLTYTLGYEDKCDKGSKIANHNEICPPFVGCIENTLLKLAD